MPNQDTLLEKCRELARQLEPDNLDLLIEDLKMIQDLQDPRSPTLREAVAPKQNGDTQAIYTECGNCGVPRFQHGVIVEACPNCGDDEIDVSLIGDVP